MDNNGVKKEIMKKVTIIMSALLVAVACNDRIAPENGGVSITDGIAYFTSSMEGDDDDIEQEDTKTLIGDGHSVIWEETDQISVRSGNQTYGYSATPQPDHNKRNTLALFYPVEEGLVLPVGQKYYALYPHDETAQWDGGKVTFIFPDKLDVTKNLPFNPSVAYTETSELKFKNVGSVIKFNVNITKVKKVVFKAVGGESLNGTVTVNCEDPTDVNVIDGSDQLIFNGNLTTASYYASILPQEYSQGLIIYLFTNNGYQSARTPAFTIGRSQRVELGNLFDHTQGAWQGYRKTYDNVTTKIEDSTAPGGFYYPLACGIDVAGEELHYNSGKDKSWNDFCDPKGTLTDETAKNLTLVDVPVNPCPNGWNLPTKAQIDKLTSLDNLIQYEHQQACYWKLRTGDLIDHRDLWGSTSSHIISSETNEKGACYRWQFKYTSYVDNDVTLYHLTENKPSSQDRDKLDNSYARFRCVRDAQQ